MAVMLFMTPITQFSMRAIDTKTTLKHDLVFEKIIRFGREKKDMQKKLTHMCHKIEVMSERPWKNSSASE